MANFRAVLAGALALLGAAAAAEEPRSAAVQPVAADVERGRALSAAHYCSACHGALGVSTTPEWPTLAGQTARYVARQLQLFRSRERTSPEMEPLAALLGDQDIADLAAFYAAQQPVVVAAEAACTPAAHELYRGGDRERRIQPCSECHDRAAPARETSGDPVLRGQQALYTARQLHAYAARTRYRGSRSLMEDAPGADAMQAAAEKLTSEEIGALASCLQRLPGLPEK